MIQMFLWISLCAALCVFRQRHEAIFRKALLLFKPSAFHIFGTTTEFWDWISNLIHILMGFWLLNHAGIKVNPCQKKRPLGLSFFMLVMLNVLQGPLLLTWFNSSPPSAAYMCQRIGVALVQIMACRLFGVKPLSKPMLGYCQLDP